MATDPDFLTEIALRHAWNIVRDGGQAAWRRTQDYNFYDEAAADAVFAALTKQNGLHIRSAEVPLTETYNTTIIAVGLSGEVPYRGFLAQDAHPKPNKIGPSGELMRGLTRAYMTEAQVAVYVISPTKDTIRMVSRFVRTAMASLGAWFMQQGCESEPVLAMTTDLEPIAVASARESALKYVRQLTFSVKLVDRLTPLDITAVDPKYALIHAEGTVVTAVPDPETRTYTPISPISLGKVGWVPPGRK